MVDIAGGKIKTTVYVGLSVDGFVARPDHTLDFLDVGPTTSDMGFSDLMASVDVLIMGRNTFDFVINAGVDWPYGTLQVVVLTHRPLDLSEELAPTVSGSAKQGPALLAELAASGRTHAYVDGGSVVQQFLATGLVDELILTRVPVLIGEGIPLFAALPHDVRLTHVATEAYENGMVQTTYSIGAK